MRGTGEGGREGQRETERERERKKKTERGRGRWRSGRQRERERRLRASASASRRDGEAVGEAGGESAPYPSDIPWTDPGADGRGRRG